MRQEPLAEVLREARSDWSAKDLAAVQVKLAKVGIGTSEDLAQALQNQLNDRLREVGQRAFSAETVQALKRALDIVEPVVPAQIEDDLVDFPFEPAPRVVVAQEEKPPVRERAEEPPPAPASPPPVEAPVADAPNEPEAREEEPAREDASEEILDVATLARTHGVPLDRLVHPREVQTLLRQLERLEGMTVPELQGLYERRGCPLDRRMRKKELVQQLHDVLIWEQLNVSGLQEVCEAQGLAVKKVQPRAELLQLLRDAKWEAVGIPVQRLPGVEVARGILEQVQGLEAFGAEQLASQCNSRGLPVVPWEIRQKPPAEKSPEYMAAGLKQAFIWNEMKPAELRRDCRAFGVALEDLDARGLSEAAMAEELLERLLQSLWGGRFEVRGVPFERLKSLKLAEDILRQLDRLQAMGSLSLKAECHRLGVPVSEQMEDALLEERLRDVLVWRHLPQPELQKEAKLLELPTNMTRDQLPLRMLRRKDQLREWEEQGIPVSRFAGDYNKALELVQEYKSITMRSRKGLEKWYRGTGFPEERDMDKSELEKACKKVSLWQMLPLEELRRDLARAEGSAVQESASQDEKEQRVDLVFQLFKHERMLAWDRKGFHALRIGNFDIVVQIVKQFDHFQAMGDKEFRKLCGDMGLPCGSGESREVLSSRVKTLMAWEMMPWPAVHKECLEHGLSVPTGRAASADESRRGEFIQQLVWKVFWGVPVGRLGVNQASNMAGHYQSFDNMTDAELKKEYSVRLEIPSFQMPELSRAEMMATLREWTLWLQLPIEELWSECGKRGVRLDGFSLPKPAHVSAAAPAALPTPPEEALRVQLLPRLFLREKIEKEEAEREELLTGFTEEKGPRAGRVDKSKAEDSEGGAVTIDPEELPEVWRYMELIRDPVMCQHVCGVKRKEAPVDLPLPAAARSWLPLEAALYVLSGGAFHPRQHGRDGEPESPPGEEDEPLVSIVCPTCDRRQHFHKQLYECFKVQDYERKELVVVDTGARPSAFMEELARRDRRVIYRFFDVDDLREGVPRRAGKRAWSLGLKRNIACCLARGEAIAHFDDDDVYAPHYISNMVPRLLRASRSSGDVPACGLAPAAAKLSEWHLLDLSQDIFHHLDVITDPSIPQADQRGWIYGWGFSYVFTRSAWELAPVPDVEFAEDLGFIEGLLLRNVPVALVKLPAHHGGLVAHTWHAGSTSGGERLVAEVGKAVARPSAFIQIHDAVKRLHMQDDSF